MNKKGQVLISFVLIIPVIIILMGMIIEYSHVCYEKNKVVLLSKDIETLEVSDKNDIIKIYDDNNIKYSNIEISDNLDVNMLLKVDSLLGNIVGKDYYEIRIEYKRDK